MPTCRNRTLRVSARVCGMVRVDAVDVADGELVLQHLHHLGWVGQLQPQVRTARAVLVLPDVHAADHCAIDPPVRRDLWPAEALVACRAGAPTPRPAVSSVAKRICAGLDNNERS